MYRGRDSIYSPTPSFRTHGSGRHGHGHGRRSRGSPPMGRRHGRPYPMEPQDSYHDYPRRSPPMYPRRSTEYDTDRYGSRGSIRRPRNGRTIPRAPSFGQRPRRASSIVSNGMSPRLPSAMLSPRQTSMIHGGDASEKHTLPPYDSSFSRVLDGMDSEDELVAMERSRRLRRIIKYSAYALIGLLVILACALTGYFLSPRTPVVALHAVNSPDSSSASKFKLQGTKMQFHVELIYRVQNDNYFDMSVDDISTALFWPDTKFALGGGRLSDIRVPSRRTVEITMPIAIRYDVKRGPPPILLGMVESCGLHDTGIGEINLEAEVQADFHTKMKQSAVQTGRQGIAIKCPVRRMATLQVDDGTSGNLGDIVRTLNA
ncbi:hypothetical protein H4R20_006284 [Coemansia guatemalensis]|uniref:Late embryogenesis abundant protein LEA-2 subgroup domain-containing protein n=1 Tax=Coemansia guatemalensis TaxID=2761395 RepID=A0A9W8LNU4_9FUNG|nr:hypothetical protein H4R20_006284 [Coemansia guatemalensis]